MQKLLTWQERDRLIQACDHVWEPVTRNERGNYERFCSKCNGYQECRDGKIVAGWG